MSSSNNLVILRHQGRDSSNDTQFSIVKIKDAEGNSRSL
jgi:hypothetical protein